MTEIKNTPEDHFEEFLNTIKQKNKYETPEKEFNLSLGTEDTPGAILHFLNGVEDFNPLHTKKGLEKARNNIQTTRNYKKFLENTYNEFEALNDKNNRSIGPGMIQPSIAMMLEEQPVEKISAQWEEPYHISRYLQNTDTLRRENNQFYKVNPFTKEETVISLVETESSEKLKTENNYKRNYAMNRAVSRQSRNGDLLFSVETEFNELFNWDETTLMQIKDVEIHGEANLVQESDIGDIMSYQAELRIGDEEIAQYTENFIPLEGYENIEATTEQQNKTFPSFTNLI